MLLKRLMMLRITVSMERLKMRMRKNMVIWVLKISKGNMVVKRSMSTRVLLVGCTGFRDAVDSGETSIVSYMQLAQEDYNLDMNTESVELAYSLPEAMVQRMARDTPSYSCYNLNKMRTVPEEGDEDDDDDMVEGDEGDEADEGEEDDDDMAEVENHDGEEDGAEEDAGIPDVAEAVDDAEDYSEYGKVKDEDEKEYGDMGFEDFKGTYGSEEIYVN
ncbi:hypothetical protein F2Q69_00011066 [Brassica cretica]|uniref:Uncharacterized protein n=1 Tax=Brassica cretica TaxID=69181 RepID=A0A8S9QK06_BRACR|nr:hypothetical protein F2Q69_00011066 [Brassica cretica]